MENLEAANEALKDEIVSLKVELVAQQEHAEAKLEAVREALKEKIIELELELDEFKSGRTGDTRVNLLEMENSELQHRISELLIEKANLKDAIEGMADDMGQLELLLSECRGEIE